MLKVRYKRRSWFMSRFGKPMSWIQFIIRTLRVRLERIDYRWRLLFWMGRHPKGSFALMMRTFSCWGLGYRRRSICPMKSRSSLWLHLTSRVSWLITLKTIKSYSPSLASFMQVNSWWSLWEIRTHKRHKTCSKRWPFVFWLSETTWSA